MPGMSGYELLKKIKVLTYSVGLVIATKHCVLIILHIAALYLYI